MSQTLLDQLRAADRAATELGPPPDVDQRVHERLRTKTRRERPSALPLGLSLAGAACAAAVFVWVSRTPAPAPRTHIVQAPTAPVLPDCALGDDGRLTPDAPHACALAGFAARVALAAHSVVQLDAPARAVTVERGTVTFEVDKRGPGDEPFVVDAVGARITVLGTRFVVDLDAPEPAVHLDEGRIALDRPEVARRQLAPGEHAPLWPPSRWLVNARPRATPAPPPGQVVARAPATTTPDAPAAARPRAPFDEMAALRALAAQRAAQHWEKALRVAQRLLARTPDEARATAYSVEVDDLMVRAERPMQERCAHRRAHQQRFGHALPGTVCR